MSGRPLLLLLTAAAAGAAALGNAAGVATGANAAPDAGEQTRLGAAIDDDLAQRDRATVRRNRALNLREQAMRAAEARMQARGATEPEAAPSPAAAAAPGAAEAADQFDELARIYQAMKPVAAALVFEQLDLDVQTRVAGKMRERSTALIMAAMTPKGAAALTMALARRGAPRPVTVAKAR